MLTKKQLIIFGEIARKPFNEYTFREIKELSKEKSNSAIQRAIAQFKSETIIKEIQKGNMKLYLINLENKKIFDYLSLYYQEEDFDSVAKSDLDRIEKELIKRDPFFSMVVFGSFAINKHKKDSDLDVAVIVDENKNNAKIAINSVSKKCLKEIHAEVFTIKEFKDMLNADYENVGKEIARKNIPIYNVSIFYNIIKGAVEHGFKC